MVSIVVPPIRTIKEAVILLVALWSFLIIFNVILFHDKNIMSIVLLFVGCIIVTISLYFFVKRYQKYRKK